MEIQDSAILSCLATRPGANRRAVPWSCMGSEVQSRSEMTRSHRGLTQIAALLSGLKSIEFSSSQGHAEVPTLSAILRCEFPYG